MTNMTKDYALAAVRSWIGDECPAVSVGALIAQLDHLTALESCADSLYLRRKLLQFFMRSGINTYMRKVILVATRPEQLCGFLHHRAFVTVAGQDH
jgi:hypothetical protein